MEQPVAALQRVPRTAQVRLAALLDIGRGLADAPDPAELRLRVATRLSTLFEGDVLFCGECSPHGEMRLALVVQDGAAVRTDRTYDALTDRATPESGFVLDAHAAQALAVLLSVDTRARAAIVLPMRTGSHTLGEIGVLRHADDAPFTEEDRELLAFGASMLGAAFVQRRRIDETESRRLEAERLEEIGRAITSSLELAEVLESVMQAVIDLTSADVCTVWRREDGAARVVGSRGRNAMPVGSEVDTAPAIEAALVERRETVVIADMSSDPRLPAYLRAQVAGDGPTGAIIVPMVCDDVVVGALSVFFEGPRAPGSEAIGILERLGLQAAIAVENARLHAEIRDLSLTDPLTGLPNRRHMEMVLAKEFEAALRGRPLTVILFDLDQFKAFNDAHGHPEGDEALRQFAFILVSEMRKMNLAVRYGGDEFIAILSESTADGAHHLVQRIEQRVRDNDCLAGIGVSAGVAEFGPNIQSPQALIEAADAAMYRSKGG